MRHVRRGRTYARKVTALLLVLVMALALPVMVQATDDVSEGVLLVEWTTIGSAGPTPVRFYVYNSTQQRTLHDIGDALSLCAEVMNLRALTELFSNLADEGLLTEEDWNLLSNFNRILGLQRIDPEGVLTNEERSNFNIAFWDNLRLLEPEEIPLATDLIRRAIEFGGDSLTVQEFNDFLSTPVLYATTSTNLYIAFETWGNLANQLSIEPSDRWTLQGLTLYCSGECGRYSPFP